MESEDLPLETLLGKYEEGTQLARVCQEKTCGSRTQNPTTGKECRRRGKVEAIIA